MIVSGMPMYVLFLRRCKYINYLYDDSEDAVVMSLDYYNSLMETVHLLRSPANAEHLHRSIAQFKAGKVSQRDLIDE